MTMEAFELLVQEAYQKLPADFTSRIDNVQIVVLEEPDTHQATRVKSNAAHLLGLYEGIPVSHRNTWYGSVPTVPDRISLFKHNILACCRTEQEVARKIEEVLYHEIGHYFGMDEAAIRSAMKDFH